MHDTIYFIANTQRKIAIILIFEYFIDLINNLS